MKPFVMDNTGRKCIGVEWKNNGWWFVADDGTLHSGATPAAYALATTHANCLIHLTKLNVKYFCASAKNELWWRCKFFSWASVKNKIRLRYGFLRASIELRYWTVLHEILSKHILRWICK